MKYIFIDPSGSFNEGKGHTGVAIMEDEDWDSLKVYSIAADKFTTRYNYWNYIMCIIKKYSTAVVIIESFMIRNNGFLTGKMPETIRLIGAMEYFMDKFNVKYLFQTPSQAKARFKDDDLCKYIPEFEKRTNGKYYLKGKMTNDHIRDALKHLLYFHKYNKSKGDYV